MIIIGEKINGTLKKTAKAILERDVEFITSLATRQVEAGADYIDVNAGTGGGDETEDLLWLIEVVQEAVDVPLCLDSANPAALKAGMAAVSQTPMVNSISGEASRLDGILPALESSHAVAEAIKQAAKMSRDSILVVNLSGRGDKDLDTALHALGQE